MLSEIFYTEKYLFLKKFRKLVAHFLKLGHEFGYVKFGTRQYINISDILNESPKSDETRSECTLLVDIYLFSPRRPSSPPIFPPTGKSFQFHGHDFD